MTNKNFIFGCVLYLFALMFFGALAFVILSPHSNFKKRCEELNGVVIVDYCVKGTAIVEKKP